MKKPVRILLIVVLATVFVVSAAQLVKIELAYKKAGDIYANSRMEYRAQSSAAPSAEADGWPAITVDLAGLQKTNPDVIGWIYIPGTDIDYPLLLGADNEKYLHQSYDLQSTASGSIFMDSLCSAGFTDDNTVIYGHNMKNGSMFGGLKKYADTDYLKTHADVYVFLPGRVLRYRTFAGYKTGDTSESYTRTFTDSLDFTGFLQYIEKNAGENLVAAPTEKAPLLTLSTCTSAHASERFVVHAVLAGEKKLP